MKIYVNTKHIKAGKPEDDESCPIAIAVREAVDKTCLKGMLKDRAVSVDYDSVSVGSLCMMSSKKMSNFVAKFDEGKPVKPFSFTLKFE